MQATMACAAMAFFLAACGGTDEASEGNGDPAQNGGGGTAAENGGGGGSAGEEQYAQGQYNITEDGAADDQYADAAPEDLPFPLPPGADIIVAGQSEEQAYVAVMNVSSGQEAYEFYLQSLPDAGFEIVSDNRADAQPQNEQEGENAGEGENAEDAPEDAPEEAPFSAVLVVEGNDLRGSMRFDEQRAIIGMSAAAFEAAAEAEAEAQEQAPEEAAPEGEAPEEAAPEQ